jgi:CO/xanthine dehydrogenase Mo-binding subunit
VELPWVDFHALFAIESHAYEIAALTNRTPPEIHRVNGAGSGAEKADFAFAFDYGKADAVMDAVTKMSDFNRKYCVYDMNARSRRSGKTPAFSEPVRGIGLASAFSSGGFYGTAASGRRCESLAHGAAVVEVEIDPFTLAAKLRGVWLAVECGETPAPKQAEAALRRTVFELLSSFVKDGGPETPDVHLSFLQTGGPPRRTGDEVYSVLPAAFANAISQAVSCGIHSLPMESGAVFRFITERQFLEDEAPESEAQA